MCFTVVIPVQLARQAAASFLRLSAVGTGGATNERAGAMASRRENKGLRALLLIALARVERRLIRICNFVGYSQSH